MANLPINPYTFVPFGNAPVRTDIKETYADEKSLLSGYMDIELTTKTQLAIPDGTKADPPLKQGEENKVHRKYPFFRLPDGQVAIPGSELRGMLRSVYEAASNSCLPFLLDDKRTSMRVPTYASIKTRGLLCCENGIWSLWGA